MRTKYALPIALCAAASMLLLAPRAASACAVCGYSMTPPNDASFSTIGWDLPVPGTLRLSLENRESFHTTRPHPTVLESTFESRTSIFAAWTPWSFVTLQWLVPLAYRTVAQSDAVAETHTFGLSDSELSGRFQVFGAGHALARHGIFLSAGVKMPFAPEFRGADGLAFGNAAQLGSGSWDPLASATYIASFDRVSLFAVESVRVTTKGRAGLRRGSTFTSTIAVRYTLGESLALMLSADAMFAAPDTVNGAHVADTGGFVGYVTPSALMQLSPRALIRVALQIPIVRLNTGTQMDSVSFLVSLVFTHVPPPPPPPPVPSPLV